MEAIPCHIDDARLTRWRRREEGWSVGSVKRSIMFALAEEQSIAELDDRVFSLLEMPTLIDHDVTISIDVHYLSRVVDYLCNGLLLHTLDLSKRAFTCTEHANHLKEVLDFLSCTPSRPIDLMRDTGMQLVYTEGKSAVRWERKGASRLAVTELPEITIRLNTLSVSSWLVASERQLREMAESIAAFSRPLYPRTPCRLTTLELLRSENYSVMHILTGLYLSSDDTESAPDIRRVCLYDLVHTVPFLDVSERGDAAAPAPGPSREAGAGHSRRMRACGNSLDAWRKAEETFIDDTYQDEAERDRLDGVRTLRDREVGVDHSLVTPRLALCISKCLASPRALHLRFMSVSFFRAEHDDSLTSLFTYASEWRIKRLKLYGIYPYNVGRVLKASQLMKELRELHIYTTRRPPRRRTVGVLPVGHGGSRYPLSLSSAPALLEIRGHPSVTKLVLKDGESLYTARYSPQLTQDVFAYVQGSPNFRDLEMASCLNEDEEAQLGEIYVRHPRFRSVGFIPSDTGVIQRMRHAKRVMEISRRKIYLTMSLTHAKSHLRIPLDIVKKITDFAFPAVHEPRTPGNYNVNRDYLSIGTISRTGCLGAADAYESEDEDEDEDGDGY